MKKILILLTTTIILLLSVIWYYLWSSNTSFSENTVKLYIPTGANYQDVVKLLQQKKILYNTTTFEQLAQWMNYPKRIRPGKYSIQKGMGNFTIIQMLRTGKQEPVILVINKLRTAADIIEKLDAQLEPDSTSLMQTFLADSNLKKWNITANQMQCLIIPDTYELYWNSSAQKIWDKLYRYQQKFWSEERKKKAAEKNLTLVQVATLASIVEEETNKKEDKYKIASTYLNRLHLAMPLQADPTCKFAVNDFSIKRVLQKHTSFQSPYNTYLVVGLPPGPICTPSKESIDAVLDAPKTDYLYFCAKEDFSGYSNFAASYEAHQLNAKKYQEALNKRGIK